MGIIADLLIRRWRRYGESTDLPDRKTTVVRGATIVDSGWMTEFRTQPPTVASGSTGITFGTVANHSLSSESFAVAGVLPTDFVDVRCNDLGDYGCTIVEGLAGTGTITIQIMNLSGVSQDYPAATFIYRVTRPET